MVDIAATQLTHSEWTERAAQHRSMVKRWTDPYRARRGAHQAHPVFDFLFSYYPFSLGKLEQWHPGMGFSLENSPGATPGYNPRHYQIRAESIRLAPENLADKPRQRIAWIHNLLVLTQHRPANFSCFGMHEWAMVYQGNQAGRPSDIRHRESASLRLSQEEIDHIVESHPIACSHFDAFRFFAPAALPFNRLQPSLDARQDFEQPGCLHTNMDLYKWASKCMPWVGSDLLWQCFQLALAARELDMQASPYDLTRYGYAPIKIETAPGRTEYEKQQREIHARAQPLRQHLIDTLALCLIKPVAEA